LLEDLLLNQRDGQNATKKTISAIKIIAVIASTTSKFGEFLSTNGSTTKSARL